MTDETAIPKGVQKYYPEFAPLFDREDPFLALLISKIDHPKAREYATQMLSEEGLEFGEASFLKLEREGLGSYTIVGEGKDAKGIFRASLISIGKYVEKKMEMLSGAIGNSESKYRCSEGPTKICRTIVGECHGYTMDEALAHLACPIDNTRKIKVDLDRIEAAQMCKKRLEEILENSKPHQSDSSEKGSTEKVRHSLSKSVMHTHARNAVYRNQYSPMDKIPLPDRSDPNFAQISKLSKMSNEMLRSLYGLSKESSPRRALGFYGDLASGKTGKQIEGECELSLSTIYSYRADLRKMQIDIPDSRGNNGEPISKQSVKVATKSFKHAVSRKEIHAPILAPGIVRDKIYTREELANLGFQYGSSLGNRIIFIGKDRTLAFDAVSGNGFRFRSAPKPPTE